MALSKDIKKIFAVNEINKVIGQGNVLWTSKIAIMLNDSSLWELGGFFGDGTPMSGTSTIRTKNFHALLDGTLFIPNFGMSVTIYFYNASNTCLNPPGQGFSNGSINNIPLNAVKLKCVLNTKDLNTPVANSANIEFR